jgi:ribose transport system substrate-binding protein
MPTTSSGSTSRRPRHATARTCRAAVAILALCAIGVLAGCGSSGSSSSSSVSTAAANTTAASGGTDLNAINSELAGLYAGKSYSEPGGGSPPPQAGKTVWLISCGQEVSSCAQVISGASAAAKAIGWKTKVIDGKSDPNAYQQGIRQAVAAKADGIFTTGVDCSVVKQPLTQAKEAGIKTVGDEAFDCNQTLGQPADKPLYDWMVTYNPGPGPQFFIAYGKAQATWTISQRQGKAKVIVMTDHEYQSIARVEEGFREGLKACSGCSIVDTVSFTGVDFGKSLQQKTQQAILKNPDANAVWMAAADGFTVGGIAQGIKASGRQSEILGIGAEGAAATMDQVRAGGPQNGGVGLALEWEGWAGIDALNRLFASQTPVSSGIGLQVYDKEHNTPLSGGYQPPIDYASAYKKAWGVAG